MNQSKLILLLKTFSKRETRRFDEYLRSPFFGKSEDALRFWSGLLPLMPDLPDKDVDRNVFFKKVYGLKNMPDDVEISRLMNLLLGKAEHFLSTEALLAIPGELELQELSTMAARGLPKHFVSSLKRSQKVVQDMPLRDERWHYVRYLLSAQELAHLQRNQGLGAEALMENMATELDAFYLSARLRILRETINRKNILAFGQQSLSVDAILNLYESSPAHHTASVQVHAKVLKMLMDVDNPQHFRDLLALVRTSGRLLTLQEQQEILTNSQNYCIRRIRLGDVSFLRHLFDLYQEALSSGVILEDGGLSPWKYKNISSVGLQLGEFAWVEGFVSTYKDKLPEAYRNNAHAYNLADLLYHRKDYAKALKMLQQVEFTDMVYAMDTRKLQLKIYYEQGATESMLSLVNAFRNWLGRQKLIAEDTKRAYLNFINLLQVIWRLETEGKASQAIPEIQATQPLVDEAWLLKMANQS